MKYLYSPEMPPTICCISNCCKVVEYSHVVECKYKLFHIPSDTIYNDGLIICSSFTFLYAKVLLSKMYG